jgi:tRNA G10  N-methylase Trm11
MFALINFRTQLSNSLERETLYPDQTAYIFIPGKNWRLSLAEIIAFFEARKAYLKFSEVSRSFFVITTEIELDPETTDSLGGTIKIGDTTSQIPSATVKNAFIDRRKQALAQIRECILSSCVFDKLLERSLRKSIFGVSVYFESPLFLKFSKRIHRFVGSCFKDGLAERGTKARFMGFRESRKVPQQTHVEVLKKGLIQTSADTLFCIGRRQTFVSRTMAVHNPFEFQKRDVGRPIQRKIYSIPPRLARIMVNLSTCLPGKTLLDPFCGVGTILQEALLAGAETIGIDIDPWCVKASCTNLEWLRNQYSLKAARYTVFPGDSRNLTASVGEETVDCIVTEPDLGPPLRHYPTESYAKRITSKLKPLYCDFLEGAYRVLRPSGNLVFVTPYVRTRSRGFITLSLEEKIESLGFRTVNPFETKAFPDSQLQELKTMLPLIDIGKKHKIGRKINLLRK